MARLRPEPFREVKRRLEAAQFVEASQKGSHVKFVRRSGDTIDVQEIRLILRSCPEKMIPVGTLRNILSQAHLSRDEGEELA